MIYKRKYRKGKIIKSLNEMMAQEFIYSGDKILHKGWFGSWQISMAQRLIDRGLIFKAVKEETNEPAGARAQTISVDELAYHCYNSKMKGECNGKTD